VKYAVGSDEAKKRSFGNTRSARAKLIAFLRKEASKVRAKRVVFAYEASGAGFGLYDEMEAAGVKCYVLAPSGLPHTPETRRRKTDERDAERALDSIRGHELGGSRLPAVWVPDPQTRDDREVVRSALDVRDKLTTVKTQVTSLLKRVGVEKPSGMGQNWTNRHRAWLQELSAEESRGLGFRTALKTLLRQVEDLEREVKELDSVIAELAERERYKTAVEVLLSEPGVGLLTAMVFLTELGDVHRFANRRKVGAYLGLVPTTKESGERSDCKGHITRMGSGRIRRVLCQATWARLRCHEGTRRYCETMVKRRPKSKRVAVVACMRRLGIRLWHLAVASTTAEQA
jgi:transposase